MLGTTFFGDFDLASAAIWGFWLFFAILVVYLQVENQREGYPLVDDDGKEAASPGLFPLAKAKTFILRDGRGTVVVPQEQRPDRDDLALARTSEAAGSPYVPTGDPMVDGVGPASWANRADHAELDGHGHPKIKPLSNVEGFNVSAGIDPRGLPVQTADGEVVGRITDMWIDAPEQMVRYLVADLNPEGSGQERLIPMNFARIKRNRVQIDSLHAEHMAGIPTIRNNGEITLLEEEKIMAWFGGGTLYATKARLEPQL
ncbi:photosynthetic reaction center subunit H [Jannaschia donghaensis]|uniref:Photosynthetic reaction center H subunit n=1 Tax=Jannaschia donghaensis TaxID=420998 RepID=A0A0M6YE26_9RHOB|nr:photosynthetic reaction center subunit H [Jannaschia donghaensis]CTQ48019.1 Photosynthetic reaction center H subunit [Jannaschia donghaensis]